MAARRAGAAASTSDRIPPGRQRDTRTLWLQPFDAELECHGHGHSTAARLARDLLELFEKAQSAHLDDRARLMLALQASK